MVLTISSTWQVSTSICLPTSRYLPLQKVRPYPLNLTQIGPLLVLLISRIQHCYWKWKPLQNCREIRDGLNNWCIGAQITFKVAPNRTLANVRFPTKADISYWVTVALRLSTLKYNSTSRTIFQSQKMSQFVWIANSLETVIPSQNGWNQYS